MTARRYHPLARLVGGAIRRRRVCQGITIEAMASRLGCSSSTWSDRELTGAHLTIDEVVRACIALQCSPTTVIGEGLARSRREVVL